MTSHAEYARKRYLSLILWVRTSWVVISIVSNTSTLQRAIGTPLEPYTASRHVTDPVPNEPVSSLKVVSQMNNNKLPTIK